MVAFVFGVLPELWRDFSSIFSSHVFLFTELQSSSSTGAVQGCVVRPHGRCSVPHRL
jgi:hypothetical protein